MNLLYPGKVLRKFTSILCKLISTHIWRHSGILSRCSEGPAPRALGCCLDSLAATMETRCRIWESLVKLPASSYVPESAGTMGDYSGDPGMVRVASARAALTLRDWRSWTNTSKIVHILHCSSAGLSSSCSLRWAAYQCTLAASPTLSLLSHSLTHAPWDHSPNSSAAYSLSYSLFGGAHAETGMQHTHREMESDEELPNSSSRKPFCSERHLMRMLCFVMLGEWTICHQKELQTPEEEVVAFPLVMIWEMGEVHWAWGYPCNAMEGWESSFPSSYRAAKPYSRSSFSKDILWK